MKSKGMPPPVEVSEIEEVRFFYTLFFYLFVCLEQRVRMDDRSIGPRFVHAGLVFDGRHRTGGRLQKEQRFLLHLHCDLFAVV